MQATSTIDIADLSRSKRFRAELFNDLTPAHTVGQAVETYLDRMSIPDNGLPFSAFSRGVRLDSKITLEDLPEADSEWTIIADVAAGGSW